MSGATDALDHAASGSTYADHGCRKLDHNGQWCLLAQPLLFGEFHRSRCLDVTPTDLASKHLLECAEALRSRGEITYNEKWQQELSRLRNDCAVALSTKYSPTGTR
jgi:hypothetical protein